MSNHALNLSNIETAIIRIWADVLGDESPDKISRSDDFFEIGGTSLSMLSVLSKLSEKYGQTLPSAVVANGASVAALALSCLNEFQGTKAD